MCTIKRIRERSDGVLKLALGAAFGVSCHGWTKTTPPPPYPPFFFCKVLTNKDLSLN